MNDLFETNELIQVAEAEHRSRFLLSDIFPQDGFKYSKDKPLKELTELVKPQEAEHYLSARQQEVLESWLESGVRFDTAHWLRSLAGHFNEKSAFSPPVVIAAMFVDTYNRADDVLDTFREKFASDEGGISTANLREVPILKIEEGNSATVGEFIDIVSRMIRNSGAYSQETADELQTGIGQFLEQSTKALEKHESSRKGEPVTYGEQEAVELRTQTLFPLVKMACRLFGSAELMRSKNPEPVKNIEQEIMALALAAQIWDDGNDMTTDFWNGNTNIVLGVLHDAIEAKNKQNGHHIQLDQRVIFQYERSFGEKDGEGVSGLSGEEIEMLNEAVDYSNARLQQLFDKFRENLNPQVAGRMWRSHRIPSIPQ